MNTTMYSNTKATYVYDDKFMYNIYCCVCYITHKCVPMQELFAKWLALNRMQQILFTYTICHILNRHEIMIFAGVLKGIQFWNAVQDIEGACGYHYNPSNFSLNLEQENQLLKVINDMNGIISTVNRKTELCGQLCNTANFRRQIPIRKGDI